MNQKGAKVFFDSKQQPLLKFVNGCCKCRVLSVGFSREGIPLVTIQEKSGEINCYRLPSDYCVWATKAIELANQGYNAFPAEVIFTEENGEYFADIL